MSLSPATAAAVLVPSPLRACPLESLQSLNLLMTRPKTERQGPLVPRGGLQQEGLHARASQGGRAAAPVTLSRF